MGKVTSYYLRIPVELSRRMQDRANAEGLTANDIVILALQAYVGTDSPPDPATVLLLSLAKWAAENYSPRAFDEHIILRASEKILADPELRALYDAAIRGENGEPAPRLKKNVAQSIGRCIKKAVRGRAFARVIVKPGSNPILMTYSLLRPSDESDDASETTGEEGPEKTPSDS